MKELWSQEDPSFHGRFSSFSGMKFSPKPVQQPTIPLVIGGTSRAAIRRAARAGNGWHPTAMHPEELSQAMRYLARTDNRCGQRPFRGPGVRQHPDGRGTGGPVLPGQRTHGDIAESPRFRGTGRPPHSCLPQYPKRRRNASSDGDAGNRSNASIPVILPTTGA